MTKFYSPLRYPGGKNRLSKFISKVCTDNAIKSHYVEPFCGGASVALYLLIKNKFEKITINDFDRSVYAFWYSVLNHPQELCNLILNTEVTIENWQIEKGIQKNKRETPLLELGFSTLFLNRTNFSGVLKGGPIGGLVQKGKYKLDCRFNKEEIISKIELISKYKKQINLYHLNVLDLIDKIQAEEKNKDTIFYFDSPYFQKGKDLYINFYNQKDHEILSNKIKDMENFHWIVSYDDTREIRDIFHWVRNRHHFMLKHFINKVKNGSEILLFKENLKIN